MPGGTLIRAPPPNPSKSSIENILELTRLSTIGPDIFTNTRELWHPPGARGIFGGAAIAQCLAAAQETIPSPSSGNNNAEFLIHSMHCYFVLAGDSKIPVLYHVERVRDGKSFITRTVQARQKGRCIFTTTLSFMRESSGGQRTVEHAWNMPESATEKLNDFVNDDEGDDDLDDRRLGVQSSGPFITKKMAIENNDSPYPHIKKARQWVKCRGQISQGAGPQAHLSALAYMSDSYFVGTLARVHNLWPVLSSVLSNEGHDKNPKGLRHKPQPVQMKKEDRVSLQGQGPAPKIGMMMSLDHTIFFHRPREVKVDEWLYSEMESPWSGNERGLIYQKIWNRDGLLVASCVQEGLVRLEQDLERSKL
ncbi:MAG: hypothetical protein Q9167_006755 [Letrouitia subvulpina]